MDYQDVLSHRVMAVQEQRSALVAAIEETRTARSLSFADDEHDPDGSTASLDQVRDVALLARVEDTLGELMAAQQRLAEGDFGRCENCGQSIAGDRLRARPETRFCVTCAARPGGRHRHTG